MDIIIERIKLAFKLTSDLVESLSEEDLKLRIPEVPSNTIGMQLWCIIGARQSYLDAIKHKGEWQGFRCDLNDAHSKTEVVKLLNLTSNTLIELKLEKEDVKVVSNLFELLEHEIQHHGQLIRFVYSNKLNFPKSWNKRYTV